MAAGRGGLRAMMARDAPNAQPAQGAGCLGGFGRKIRVLFQVHLG